MKARLRAIVGLLGCAAVLLAASPRPSGIVGRFPRWKGDFEGMVERRVIRAVTTFSRTAYFLEAGEPKGAVYEALTEFESFVNERLGHPHPRVRVMIVPVARDELFPALTEGRADLAAANLTITPDRSDEVDFSAPIATGVREIVVTGPEAPPLENLEDLAGTEVHVRLSSSYHETLQRFSARLQERRLPPVRIRAVDEELEAEDVLELVAAGVFPMTVVDAYLARLWGGVLEGLTVREDLAVGTDRSLAWAFRKGSPDFAKVLDDFVRGHKKGTLFGNVLINRYYRSDEWIRNPASDNERPLFEKYRDHFRDAAEEFGVDWLLAAAQGYQESRFDQGRVSTAGAVGIMQIKPSTAADPNVGIPDVSTPRENIRAGIKYLAFLRERYFSDGDLDELNRGLFALAAYNAGPARVRRLRAEAEARGLDPDRWFRHVEQLAPRETVRYVGNIFKYYVGYREYLRRRAELERLEKG